MAKKKPDAAPVWTRADEIAETIRTERVSGAQNERDAEADAEHDLPEDKKAGGVPIPLDHIIR